MSDTGTADSGLSATWSGSDFAAAYVAAWNAHDADRVLGFMTSDVVYDHSAWPVTMRGHDEVRPFMSPRGKLFPTCVSRSSKARISWGRTRRPSGGVAPAR